MGFNNSGAEAVAARLAGDQKRDLILGINIGKTKLVSAEDAYLDYQKSASLLAPMADYLVVNVSSPNTPGLRDLQAVSSLRPILTCVQEAVRKSVPERKVPVLVKIAPDLSNEDIEAVADLALELKLDGIIATNTTIGRGGLTTPSAEVESLGAGGLSGAPLKARALEVLELLASRVQGKLVLISAGGIETPEDVKRRLDAGATLVQIYSALIFDGPSLPTRLHNSL
jgi:dihydroorotate dehydrogenase